MNPSRTGKQAADDAETPQMNADEGNDERNRGIRGDTRMNNHIHGSGAVEP
jgi:hypothetical protein